ncbi:MAG: hypothetical protein CMI52_00505 [Parcubacteria group bacterium]|nr:hypothetical protein [Parcubacteria group bacterium]
MIYCADCQHKNDLLVNTTRKSICEICGEQNEYHHIGNKFLKREGFSTDPSNYTPKHPQERFFE